MKALFMVHNSDLRNPIRAKILAKYGIWVVVPTLDFTRAREINAKARLWAYWCLPIAPHYGSSTSLYGRHRAALDPHLLRDENGIPVRNKYQDFELQLTDSAYKAQAEFIAANTPDEAEGLYMDCTWAVPPESWLKIHSSETEEVLARWLALRDYFLKLLRYKGIQIIIGNVGRHPWMSSSYLTGITIETPEAANMEAEGVCRAFNMYPSKYCVRWYSEGYEGLCYTGERMFH